MEKQIIEFKNNNDKILIETEVTPGTVMVAAGDNIVEAAASMEEALEHVIHFAEELISKFSNMKINKPSEVEISLGLKLNGKVNFWVVSCDGEGSLNVTLKWTDKPKT
jgi:hypothetical protein